jgi:hypothetical protein
MPKYLLLKHYSGGPEAPSFPPMSEWTPEEITAHIAFQQEVGRTLTESGEFVDAQALAPDGAWVQYGGDAGPVVLDGPFPEAKELIAGWFMIDVESQERAYEVASYVSSAPGPGGRPIREWLEVRPVMSAPATIDEQASLAADVSRQANERQ